jgi:hypothetical protein
MIEIVIGIAFFAALLLAQVVPRFSMYVLAPALYLALAGFFLKYRPYFSFEQSDATTAGVVVPLLMWGLLVAGAGLGATVVAIARSTLVHGPSDPAPSTHMYP